MKSNWSNGLLHVPFRLKEENSSRSLTSGNELQLQTFQRFDQDLDKKKKNPKNFS